MARQIDSMTFRELVVAVAQQRGTADQDEKGEMIVPTDDAERRKCRDIVRKGWERFVSERSWRWMRQTIEVDTEADSATIVMPWYFDGRVDGDVFYAPGTSGPRKIVNVVDERQVLDMQQEGQSGDPDYIAFRRRSAVAMTASPRAPSDAVDFARGWEAVLYPTPSSVRTLRMVAMTYPLAVWELDDRHFAGRTFNRAVEYACRAECEIVTNRAAGPYNQLYLNDALPKAVQLDQESGPRLVGVMRDGDALETQQHRPIGAISVNGVLI